MRTFRLRHRTACAMNPGYTWEAEVAKGRPLLYRNLLLWRTALIFAKINVSKTITVLYWSHLLKVLITLGTKVSVHEMLL